MRRLLVIALAAAAVPATATAAEVDVMVVGKERVLRAPAEVRLKVRTVTVAGRRCRVGAATPLSVLAATKLKLGLRDYGRCGRSGPPPLSCGPSAAPRWAHAARAPCRRP